MSGTHNYGLYKVNCVGSKCALWAPIWKSDDGRCGISSQSQSYAFPDPAKQEPDDRE